MKILKRVLAASLAITLAISPLAISPVPKIAKASIADSLKTADKWSAETMLQSLENNGSWNTGYAKADYDKSIAAANEIARKYDEFKKPFLTWSITDTMATSSITWKTVKYQINPRTIATKFQDT